MIDRHRFILLAILIVGLLGFGLAVALGTVKQENSYGLLEVIGVLGTLAGTLSGNGGRPDKADDSAKITEATLEPNPEPSKQ